MEGWLVTEAEETKPDLVIKQYRHIGPAENGLTTKMILVVSV